VPVRITKTCHAELVSAPHMLSVQHAIIQHGADLSWGSRNKFGMTVFPRTEL